MVIDDKKYKERKYRDIFLHSLLLKTIPYSSNKRRVSKKCRTFGYPHRNKRLSLIRTSPLIIAIHLNAALIKIVTNSSNTKLHMELVYK